MLFEKFQKVKIREDLINVVDEHFGIWSDMLEMQGKEVEIASTKETKYGDRYTIKGSVRSWSEDCFEKVDDGKVREVKRLAKVGEWIKVVEASRKYGNYKNGDVIKVKKLYKETLVVESYFNNSVCRLVPSEYVVLENCQPYKVDWSKISNREISEELLRRFGGNE